MAALYSGELGGSFEKGEKATWPLNRGGEERKKRQRQKKGGRGGAARRQHTLINVSFGWLLETEDGDRNDDRRKAMGRMTDGEEARITHL